MPKEIAFEGGKVTETGMDIVLISKQDVEFTDPSPPKTEEARVKHRDKMIEFIHKQGFKMGMDSPERRVLLVDEGLAIGIFKSLDEIYDYVKQGYPAADIERHKSELLANGYPEDFHKLPPAVREQWNELPEDAKQIIREKGAEILEMHKVEDGEDGEKIFHPNSNFQPNPEETEEDEKCLKYIEDSGFQMHAFEDGGVGVKVDAKYVIGPFASLADAYQYFKEMHHLDDIEIIRQMDAPTVH